MLLILGAYMQTWQLRLLPNHRIATYAAKAALMMVSSLVERMWTRRTHAAPWRRVTRVACEVLRWAAFLILFKPTPVLAARLPLQRLGALVWLASWRLPGSLALVWPRRVPRVVRRAVRMACAATMFLVWPWIVLEMFKAAMLTLLIWTVWDGRHEVWEAVASGSPLLLTPVLSRAVL